MISSFLKRVVERSTHISNGMKHTTNKFTQRFTTATSPASESYSTSAKLMHWGMASGILSCFALVQAKNYTSDKKMKGKYMFWHKSMGLLMGICFVPRVAVRLSNKVPKLPEGNVIEHALANLSHWTLYSLMLFMPLSGVAMGYFGGKGLPFFFTTIPGATKENKNGKIAKNAWYYHKNIGQVFEYFFVPLHVGAVGFHFLRGQNILKRINPFL